MTDTITLPRSVVEQALAITTHWLELDKRNHCDLLTVSEYKLITGAVENLRAALKQPQVEQAPLAYYVMNGVARYQLFVSKAAATLRAKEEQKRHDLSGSLAAFHVVPLYASPQPKRQPLTDGEIKKLIPDGDEWKYEVGFAEATEFARAIERAHGITGEQA